MDRGCVECGVSVREGGAGGCRGGGGGQEVGGDVGTFGESAFRHVLHAAIKIEAGWRRSLATELLLILWYTKCRSTFDLEIIRTVLVLWEWKTFLG